MNSPPLPACSCASPKAFLSSSFAAIATSPPPNPPPASSAPPPRICSADLSSLCSLRLCVLCVKFFSYLRRDHHANRTPSSNQRRRHSTGREVSAARTSCRCHRTPRARQGNGHHFLEKSFHPAHHSLPRLLQLLHLPQGPRSARRAFHDPGGSACPRRTRPRRRLQGSSLQPRRSARKDFSRGPRIPPRTGLLPYARLSRRHM